jgi:hypothetical protein
MVQSIAKAGFPRHHDFPSTASYTRVGGKGCGIAIIGGVYVEIIIS